MIHSTAFKFAAVLVALVAFTSAAPHPKVASVKTGYVGTGDINLNHAASHLVNANNLHLHDAVQNIRKVALDSIMMDLLDTNILLYHRYSLNASSLIISFFTMV